MDNTLTAKEAAEKFGTSIAVFWLWRKRGLIKEVATTKPRKYKEVEILALIESKIKCARCGVSLGRIDLHNQTGAFCDSCKNHCCKCDCQLKDNRYRNTRFCINCKKLYERLNSERRRNISPSDMQKAVKKSKLKIKIEVFSYYSNGTIQCNECGFTDIRALSIDHINGGGHTHKNQHGTKLTGESLYRWLKKNRFPSGFQVLCMNHQFIKRYENMENTKYKSK